MTFFKCHTPDSVAEEISNCKVQFSLTLPFSASGGVANQCPHRKYILKKNPCWETIGIIQRRKQNKQPAIKNTR